VLWARAFALEVGVPLLAFALFMLGSIGLQELGLGWVAATVIAAGVALVFIFLNSRWSVRRRPRGAWTPEQREQLQRARKCSSAVSFAALGIILIGVLTIEDEFFATPVGSSLLLGLLVVAFGAPTYARARERALGDSRESS
jgi:hypothetical protein